MSKNFKLMSTIVKIQRFIKKQLKEEKYYIPIITTTSRKKALVKIGASKTVKSLKKNYF